MAPRVLSALFWCFALFLVGYGWISGGWMLVVPGAVAVAALLFAADLWLHRRLVVLDRHLVRAALHLLSAAALAAACMVWLVRVLVSRAP
jgi:hypothetical protein